MTTIAPSLLLEEVRKRQRARECLIGFTEYTYSCHAPAPHHRLIADRLKGVIDGRIKRLMVFMPPRHGKSRLSTIQFPAWYLGRYPDRQIISASYNADLAASVTSGNSTR